MKAEYLSHMGSDLTVANAARVSFDKESDWARNPDGTYAGPNARDSNGNFTYQLSQADESLIKFLARGLDTKGWVALEKELIECHYYDDAEQLILKIQRMAQHWTPFAHPQITIRETVPIFVARQRFKHQIGFVYNEVSRRYVDDPPEFFSPDAWRSRPEAGIKQGSGSGTVAEMHYFSEVSGVADFVPPAEAYSEYLSIAEKLYQDMIDSGVAPEQARMVLPQSMMTSYYVTGSLAAWARAYNQRSDSHAQKEIRDLASDWDTIIAPLFPVSWRCLTGTP